MALYTRKLKQHERRAIETHLSQPEEDLPFSRLQIIVLSAAGKRVPEISQEIQLQGSAAGDRLNYQVGAYYFKEDGKQDFNWFLAALLGPHQEIS